MTRLRCISALGLLALCGNISATEYFLGTGGRDANDGLAPGRAFGTIQRAVSFLMPGDTLTVLPGEYRQSMEWYFAGDAEHVTTIRAQIPGSVHFRGDESAPAFQAVPGAEQVYVTEVESMPLRVLERDTLKRYTNVPSVMELGFTPGSSFLDAANKRVYIRTSDGRPPEEHTITFSRLAGDAFHIFGSSKGKEADTIRNLVIDGLIFSGYNPDESSRRSRSWTFSGIYMRRPEKCVIRNCVVYLSGGGISLNRPVDTDIDDCTAFSNNNEFNGSGGNIICYNPTIRTRIRRCRAFDSQGAGIRMYGGIPAEDSLIEDCVAFGNSYGDIWIKYPSDSSYVRRCYASNSIHSRLAEYCIFSNGDGYYFGKAQHSIVRSREKSFDESAELADPVHGDYRPQSTSVFRNPERGIAPFDPHVLFVTSVGSDFADGNSLKTAFKTPGHAALTLADGGAIYLEPAQYPGDIICRSRKNITIRGRDTEPAVFTGKLILEQCSDVTLENINFMQAPDFRESSGITIRNCAFAPAVRFRCGGLRLLHNAFQGDIVLESADTEARANIFNGTRTGTPAVAISNAFNGPVPLGEHLGFQETPHFADPAVGNFHLVNAGRFDGRSPEGMPVGPYQRMRTLLGGTRDFRLNSTSPTTANFSFFSVDLSQPIISVSLMDAKPLEKSSKTNEFFHTVSLTGLQPGKKYSARMRTMFRPSTRWSGAPCLPVKAYETAPLSFTLPISVVPVTWHVAVTGNDANDGMSLATALRNIGTATLRAKAGDTVLVHAGQYFEEVRIGVAGAPNARFTLKAAPGEKVILNGGNKVQLRIGITVADKPFVTIEDLRFQDYMSTLSRPSAGIRALSSAGLIIRRCLYDGRPPRESPPFILADACPNMLVENCVGIRGFHGFTFNACADLEVRNCVFIRNQVYHGYVTTNMNAPAHFHHNIFFGHELQKAHNPVLGVGEATTFRENDNCYAVRLPPNIKPLFGIHRADGKSLPLNDAPEILTEEWRRQGRFGNQSIPYQEFCRIYGRKPTSLFCDPGFPVIPNGLYHFKDLEDWFLNYIKGKASPEQKALFNKSYREELMLLPDGNRREIDFKDFFATNPELRKRGIGLDPDAFRE